MQGQEQPQPRRRGSLHGPVHKRPFPAVPPLPPPPPRALPRPRPLHPRSTRGMSRAAPDRLLRLGAFPQIWSPCAVTGEAGGWERGPISSRREGPRGEPAGEADITAQQPFKPLTQPAPRPGCPSPDTELSFLWAPRNRCECTEPGAGGEVGSGLAVAVAVLRAGLPGVRGPGGEVGSGLAEAVAVLRAGLPGVRGPSPGWGSPPSQPACLISRWGHWRVGWGC